MNEAGTHPTIEPTYRQREKNQAAQTIIKVLEHVLELAEEAGQTGMAADISEAVTSVKERHASDLRQTLQNQINRAN